MPKVPQDSLFVNLRVEKGKRENWNRLRVMSEKDMDGKNKFCSSASSEKKQVSQNHFFLPWT
jgi:hypothetical protein